MAFCLIDRCRECSPVEIMPLTNFRGANTIAGLPMMIPTRNNTAKQAVFRFSTVLKESLRLSSCEMGKHKGDEEYN